MSPCLRFCTPTTLSLPIFFGELSMREEHTLCHCKNLCLRPIQHFLEGEINITRELPVREQHTSCHPGLKSLREEHGPGRLVLAVFLGALNILAVISYVPKYFGFGPKKHRYYS